MNSGIKGLRDESEIKVPVKGLIPEAEINQTAREQT